MNIKIAPKTFAGLFATGLLSTLIANLIPPTVYYAPASAQTAVTQETQLAQSITIADLSNFNLQADISSFNPTNIEPSLIPGRGILGTDDRVEVRSNEYPWAAIGRIEGIRADGDQYICTGTLISADVVLTNAHCVVDSETGQFSRVVRFMPNMIDGEIPDLADVAYVQDAYVGTDRPTAPHPDDWAFLKLDQPIGEKYGWLGWVNLPSSTLMSGDYRQQLVMAGYSGDYPDYNPGATAGAHIGCSIVDEADGILLHDCDTFGGSSGGPILGLVNGEPRIVAVNSAEALDEAGGAIINVAVPIERIVAQLN